MAYIRNFCLFFITCFCISGLAGCAAQAVSQTGQDVNTTYDTGSFASSPLPAKEKETPKETPADPGPRFKSLSPLDIQRVSMSFVKEDYHIVLQILAQAAGLNLVIDSEVETLLGSARTLTAEYVERPVRDVLDSVCLALNISWVQSGGTIYIQATTQRILHLDFLGSVRQSRFNVGGDVLGGGSGESSDVLTPLTGSFELSGQTSDVVTDIYEELKTAMEKRMGDQGSFFLNRQTGTLMIRGRPSLVKEIEDYVGVLSKKYRRQVLIEAKIIEVELYRNHELGIDWRALEATISQSPIQDVGAVFNISSYLADKSPLYSLHLSQRYYNISTVFHALEDYGQLKIVSNPKLKVMNGQSALISVGQSISYLKSLEIETISTESSTQTAPTVEIGSIFDGILLGVTPVIDADGSINLHIVPIKSDLVSLDEREFEGGNRYAFPRVNLREVSTVIRTRSGEIVILGGLIHERNENDDIGLPILSRLPIVGSIFKHTIHHKRRVELVIVLQLDVIGNE